MFLTQWGQKYMFFERAKNVNNALKIFNVLEIYRILPGTVSINGNLMNILQGPVCK